MGVAGGELIIPAFILLFGVDVKVAGSMRYWWGCRRCGLLRHFAQGSVLRETEVWRGTTLPLGLGSIAGAILGALALGLVPSQALKVGLGVVPRSGQRGASSAAFSAEMRGETETMLSAASLARIELCRSLAHGPTRTNLASSSYEMGFGALFTSRTN